MIPFTFIIILVLFLHWFGDFVLQSNDMAMNKSKSIKWLSIHCLVYTLTLCICGIPFAIVNGISHWCIDYCTSKITSKLWLDGDRHNFFVMIGFDQFLHVSILIVTAMWLIF